MIRSTFIMNAYILVPVCTTTYFWVMLNVKSNTDRTPQHQLGRSFFDMSRAMVCKLEHPTLCVLNGVAYDIFCKLDLDEKFGS